LRKSFREFPFDYFNFDELKQFAVANAFALIPSFVYAMNEADLKFCSEDLVHRFLFQVVSKTNNLLRLQLQLSMKGAIEKYFPKVFSLVYPCLRGANNELAETLIYKYLPSSSLLQSASALSKLTHSVFPDIIFEMVARVRDGEVEFTSHFRNLTQLIHILDQPNPVLHLGEHSNVT